MAILLTFLWLLAVAFWLLIIVRVVLSWTNPTGGGGLIAFVYQATEPILAPIRRVLPPTAGVDWSPFVAMLVIGAILSVLSRMPRL
jgi:YggT family protein